MKILALGNSWQHVWLRNFTVYTRYWKTNIIPPFIQPIFLLLIMGLAVGSLVKGDVNGMPYIVFVTPGIMATESLLRAAFECTYGSFYRMKYQHTFDAIICTPVTPEEVALGEIMWGATKSLISSTVLFTVMVAIGVVKSPAAVFSFIIVLVGGVNFAAISIAMTAKTRDFEDFQFFFAVIFPLIFVCGTYFPVTKFPMIVQYLLYLIPLTHVVDTTRALISGVPTPFLLWKILYIIVSTVLIVELAVRLLAKRLID